MARSYTLKKRAEQQADTRRRIVESAVHLHSTLGPGQTNLSMVAEHAGVQRHTLYAHFPDERSLYFACSGYALERDPLPDSALWSKIEDRPARLRTALAAIYGWYARNARMAACVLRDAEYHALTREMSELRIGPQMAAYRELLGAKLNAKQRAVLNLALGFYTWRSLAQSGLSEAGAAAIMANAIANAK